MSYEAAARYVAAGAALLDEKGPEHWRETLYAARERLDISSLNRCVLGLLYGSFVAGVDVLWSGVRGTDRYLSEEFTRVLFEHGFDHSELSWLPDDEDRANYEELTSEWLDIIEP